MSKALKILVTRPLEQGVVLAQKLNAMGYEASTLALTEISPLKADIPKTLAPLLIFVSANAVRQGLPQLREAGIDLSNCSLNAIGPATASALAAEGLISETPTSGFRSEELLQHLSEKLPDYGEVVIVCGVGGRGYLQRDLEKQGLKVIRLEVYSRHPSPDLESAFEKVQQSAPPDLISLMNGEAVITLSALIDRPDRVNWKSIPLVVSSQRIQQIAENSGFLSVLCQTDPTEGGLIEVLAQFSQK